ncbi:helix-turn-helix domain-containing protein [Erysipelothrix aquatica]|uniref:helix-turn-helix domain-containing protein n=1 Tax=Erysipelothrix aquatica TaxID=2683714 RepID=UPI00135B17FF|nr:helix-turn-helix transcriptional regulator [Erysipelothrix aquatica]
MNQEDFRISYAAARVNAGLTQKEASIQLKISEFTLINYETGKTIPRWDKHDLMAELYKIPKNMLRPPSK